MRVMASLLTLPFNIAISYTYMYMFIYPKVLLSRLLDHVLLKVEFQLVLYS